MLIAEAEKSEYLAQRMLENECDALIAAVESDCGLRFCLSCYDLTPCHLKFVLEAAACANASDARHQCLKHLLSVENLRGVLTTWKATSSATTRGSLFICETLLFIARHWLNLPEDKVIELRSLVNNCLAN